MVTRIDHLTPEQTAQMEGWADMWIEKGRCTDEADWQSWEEGAAACYGFAGVEWPGVVVRACNPLSVALSGPMAGHIVDKDVIEGLQKELTEQLGAILTGVPATRIDILAGRCAQFIVVEAVRQSVAEPDGDVVARLVNEVVDKVRAKAATETAKTPDEATS